MRRSSYTGSSYRQYGVSRPSSCISRKKIAKKRRAVQKNQTKKNKYSSKTKETQSQRQSKLSEVTIDANFSPGEDSDIQLEILSRNFELFLCFKNLKGFIQKQYKIKFFKRWQHQFASSIIQHIKYMKATSSNELSQYNKRKPSYQISMDAPTRNNTDQFYLEDKNLYTNSTINHPSNNKCVQNSSGVVTNDLYDDNLPILSIHETANPDEIANSVISPNSSILIASTSPNDNNKDDLSLSIDKILDFSDLNAIQNISQPPRKDSVDNFLQTITEFVSSDEFNSDTLDQISTQKKSKINQSLHRPPSPPASKPNPRKYNNNANDDPLGATLPTDLFTSSYSELSPNKSPPRSYFSKESQKTKYPQKKERQSPIKMDEKQLIQAAIADEFEHGKKRLNPKQINNDTLQQSPKSRKRRKIIIVHEYSESDDNDENKNHSNYSIFTNNDIDINDICQLPTQRKSLFPKNNKHNFESPQKKFTFSDESFSDENQAYTHPIINSEKDRINLNNPNYHNSDAYTYANNNDNDYHKNGNIQVNSTKNNKGNKNKINQPKNKSEEESELHLSSTIEIPQAELKDIIRPPSRVGVDVQTDDSSFSNSNNVSVMTMTNDSADTKHFFGQNYKIPNINSSDEIEFLIKDDNESPNKIQIKSSNKPVFNNKIYSDDDSF